MAKKGFEFLFKNPIVGTEDVLTNVLFINDAPSEIDALRLEAMAVPDVTVTLKPVDHEEASDSHYHFKLTCRPDTLALPEQIVLDASHAALWDMVYIPETVAASPDGERAPGDVDFYFLYKGDAALAVTADAPLRLTLRKVGAASRGGTRPTINQLTLNKRETDVDKFVVLAGPGGDYNLTENANLDLIAPLGQGGPTLTVGFVSSDVVLNDGDTKNYLLLRIQNTGVLPISLAPEGSATPSTFTLSFTGNSLDITIPGVLARYAQIDSFHVPGRKDSSGTNPDWSGKDGWTVTRKPLGNADTWELTPRAGKTALSPNEVVEVPISNIVTGHATGRTPLRIRYSGLPGHGDGALVAYIQKSPLVFADVLPVSLQLERRVGIGTASPSTKLTVETAANSDGITHTDGAIKLTTRVDTSGAALGTGSNHNLRFFTHGDTKVMLTTDGKLGIGTTTPEETLHVQGNLRVNGELKNAGPFVFRANTDKNPAGEDLARFMDKDGNQVLTLKSDGKLGIGTDSPSENLTVKTAAKSDGITHTDGTIKLTTTVDDSGAALGTRSNHNLRFFTNGATKVTLTTGGNLGIGTAAPSEKLHVAGNLRIDSDFKKGPGPFVFWANTDKVADADIVRFNDKDNNTALQLKSDGRLVLKAQPFECWTATLGEGESMRSPYKTADWVGIVAGFLCNAYDDPKDKEVSFYCRVQPHTDGYLYVKVFHEAGHSRWAVQVLFIRRELVKGEFTYPGWG